MSDIRFPRLRDLDHAVFVLTEARDGVSQRLREHVAFTAILARSVARTHVC